jgi:hypothetical protein
MSQINTQKLDRARIREALKNRVMSKLCFYHGVNYNTFKSWLYGRQQSIRYEEMLKLIAMLKAEGMIYYEN